MKRNSKKAFTLIELLIVIAIVGIIASIILVSLSNSKARSRGVALKGTLNSLKGAVALCCATSTNALKTTPLGGPLCSDTTMGQTLLPDLNDLGVTNATYLAGGQYGAQCGTGNPVLEVRIAGAKNTSCSASATGIRYYISPTEIRYSDQGGNYASSTSGFPPGC